MTLLAIIVLAIAILILVSIDVHFVIRKHRFEIEQLKERVGALEEKQNNHRKPRERPFIPDLDVPEILRREENQQ